MNDFLFLVLPYVALTLFIVVPIIRRRRGGFAFTTRASGFFERPSLGIAVLAFHWGIITVFVMHLLGYVGGVRNNTGLIDIFHWVGLIAGLALLYGASLALLRRLLVPEMRAMSWVEDYVILVLVIAVVATGLYPVIADKSFGLSMLVAPWVKGVLTFSPEVGGMAGMAAISKAHVSLGMVFIAYFPFTKLVHVWTYPFTYLRRPFVSLRSYRKAMS